MSNIKLSTLFIINAVFATLGAFCLLVIPAQSMTNYGATLNESGTFLSQVMGITILAVAVISYMAKDIKDAKALKALLSGFIIAHAGALLFAINAIGSGVINQIGWLDVIIHGVLAAGFGYYLAKSRS